MEIETRTIVTLTMAVEEVLELMVHLTAAIERYEIEGEKKDAKPSQRYWREQAERAGKTRQELSLYLQKEVPWQKE